MIPEFLEVPPGHYALMVSELTRMYRFQDLQEQSLLPQPRRFLHLIRPDFLWDHRGFSFCQKPIPRFQYQKRTHACSFYQELWLRHLSAVIPAQRHDQVNNRLAILNPRWLACHAFHSCLLRVSEFRAADRAARSPAAPGQVSPPVPEHLG